MTRAIRCEHGSQSFASASGPCKVNPSKDGHKFFSAVASKKIFRSQPARDDASDKSQDGVTRWVSEGIVDALEMIDVQQQQAQL